MRDKIRKLHIELNSSDRLNDQARLIARSTIYTGGSLIILFYILVTWVTAAHFMADTADYVASVVARLNGVDWHFWEVGHLLWRPLGYVTYVAFKSLLERLVGKNPNLAITLAFMMINWVLGLVAALSLYGILRSICKREWVARLVTLSFICSHAFLNFSQTGSSYSAGLAFLLLGFYLIIRRTDWIHRERLLAWLSGLSLTFSVLLWLPYVLAVPVIMLWPVLVNRSFKSQVGFTLRIVAAFCLFLSLAYAAVLLNLGANTPSKVYAWVKSSPSIGTTKTRGVAKMVFGFARSFIYMGDDGIIFKRYLIKDPYNPVSINGLIKVSLWKLGLFYLTLLSLLFSLLRLPDKRIFVFCTLGIVIIIAFAILFDGGAIERYLPMYPFFFIALSHVLNLTTMRLIKVLLLIFLVISSLTNFFAMEQSTLYKQQERAASRLEGVRKAIRPHSIVYVVNWQDEAISFERNYPFHPSNANDFQINALVTPGTTSVSRWKEDFASRALSMWQLGGDVWISTRALKDRPLPEWNWAEGDDPAVSWADFPKFFKQFDFGCVVGGDDGFILLLPTLRNRTALNEIAQKLDSSSN